MTYSLDQLRDLRDAIDAHLSGKPVEFQLEEDGVWYLGSTPDWNFPRVKYRPKREPVTRPWNCPADVPMPVCWVREKAKPDLYAWNVIYVSKTHFGGCYTPQGLVRFGDVDELSRLEYSTTCRPDDWHPLTVEENP